MPARKKPQPNGRPPAMTPATIAKLEEAFAWGCSDVEACLWADIAPATLYKYQVKNPKFTERKASLKEKPVLLARKAVVQAIVKGDRNMALAYLDRKRREEFSTKSQVENSGEQSITVNIKKYEASPRDGD